MKKYIPPEQAATPEALAQQLVSLATDDHGTFDHPDGAKPMPEMPLNLAMERLLQLADVADKGKMGDMELDASMQLAVYAGVAFLAEELHDRLSVLRKRINADVARTARALEATGKQVDGLLVNLNMGAFTDALTTPGRPAVLCVKQTPDKVSYDEKLVESIIDNVDIMLAGQFARDLGVRATKTAVEKLAPELQKLLAPARIVKPGDVEYVVKETKEP